MSAVLQARGTPRASYYDGTGFGGSLHCVSALMGLPMPHVGFSRPSQKKDGCLASAQHLEAKTVYITFATKVFALRSARANLGQFKTN